jgi:phosphatidylglycerol:prolipoprotein diacylglycerol transferase
VHIQSLSGFLPSFQLFGMTVPVYFLVTALAFIAAMLLLVQRADSHGLSRNRALDTSLVLMISGFVGSRVFHILVEEPAYYWARPWLVFDFWSGGFVWYGGALLSGACVVLFLRWKREPIGRWLDLFAPVCALGYAVGRMACVLTGCCYGRVAELPSFMGGELVRHPTQSYAVVGELGTLALLLWLERKRSSGTLPMWLLKILRPDGQLFFVWLLLHACGRIFMEAFRDDPRGPEPLGLSVSTWLSLALLVSSLAVLTKQRSHPQVRP